MSVFLGAEMTVVGIAKAAGVTIRTVNRLELGGEIHVAPKKRHGHVSSDRSSSRICSALSKSTNTLGDLHHRQMRRSVPKIRRERQPFLDVLLGLEDEAAGAVKARGHLSLTPRSWRREGISI